MPAEKPPTKCSENRRSNKPIMEKRRRARINSCLNDLKALILEALKKDPARHSKLEKADILEMTVKHLSDLQRQQMALATATDPSVANKFRAGFNECANEVTRYLTRMDGLDTSSRHRLLNHLANCLNGLGAVETFGNLAPPAAPPMSILPAIQPLNIHVNPGMHGQMPLTPHASPTNGGSGDADGAAAMASPARIVNGLHLVPTRLPNGDFALLLPASYSLTAGFPASNVVSDSSASLASDTNTTNISHNALAPLTVNLPRHAAPPPAASTKPSAAMMSVSNPTSPQHARVHSEKSLTPTHARRGMVKLEPLTEEQRFRDRHIRSAPSPDSYRFNYDAISSHVHSEVFCKETLHKLEPWRPW